MNRALAYAHRLARQTIRRTRGSFLSRHAASLWLDVADAYDVAADSLWEAGNAQHARAAALWAAILSQAASRARSPLPARCSAVTWRIDPANGYVVNKAQSLQFASGQRVAEILRAAHHQGYTHGWDVFLDGSWRYKIEKDDDAALFPTDSEAVPIAIATFVALTGCDVGDLS